MRDQLGRGIEAVEAILGKYEPKSRSSNPRNGQIHHEVHEGHEGTEE